MALATYSNQSPCDIRSGDTVADSRGTYTAFSDAEKDQWGDFMVRSETGWRTYSDKDKVTITFDQVEDQYA